MGEKRDYRYSNENAHDISNHGKRWSKADKDLVWNLHYEQHWNNQQIAEKFKRTECGIMVMIDIMYKDKREHEELVCKKYLYMDGKSKDRTQNAKRWSEGKRWSKAKGKWVKEEKDDSSEYETETDSEDDEPIGARMDRMRKQRAQGNA